jgi:hypothetical protein
MQFGSLFLYVSPAIRRAFLFEPSAFDKPEKTLLSRTCVQCDIKPEVNCAEPHLTPMVGEFVAFLFNSSASSAKSAVKILLAVIGGATCNSANHYIWFEMLCIPEMALKPSPESES